MAGNFGLFSPSQKSNVSSDIGRKARQAAVFVALANVINIGSILPSMCGGNDSWLFFFFFLFSVHHKLVLFANSVDLFTSKSHPTIPMGFVFL